MMSEEHLENKERQGNSKITGNRIRGLTTSSDSRRIGMRIRFTVVDLSSNGIKIPLIRKEIVTITGTTIWTTRLILEAARVRLKPTMSITTHLRAERLHTTIRRNLTSQQTFSRNSWMHFDQHQAGIHSMMTHLIEKTVKEESLDRTCLTGILMKREIIEIKTPSQV